MQTIEITRQQDYERFEANRRFEETTDIAERIGYPIDITIPYTYREGVLYARTDTVERPFHNQTYQAKLAGTQIFTGDQSFENIRLSHEHDEALDADELAAGRKNGNIMIKLSKIPDAVVENKTNIKGYRQDLLRSFVRIYYRTPEGVDCRLFTLDHNNAAGMERVGSLLGIDTNRSSEDILSDSTYLHVTEDVEQFVEGLVGRTKAEYDEAVLRTSGRHAHAGSSYTSRHDAMASVTAQESLLAQHMAAILSIMGRGLGEGALEAERQKTAAAIKLATEGQTVTSNGDASVTSEVASGNYDRNCATGTDNGMNQAQSMENIWTQGQCQVCFIKTKVGSCMVCARCAAADDRGVDLLKLRARNLRHKQTEQALAANSMKQILSVQTPPSKHELIRRQYGEKVKLRRRIVVGSVVEEVYDSLTNTVLDTLNA